MTIFTRYNLGFFPALIIITAWVTSCSKTQLPSNSISHRSQIQNQTDHLITSKTDSSLIGEIRIKCPQESLFGWGGVYDSHSYDIEKQISFTISSPNHISDTTLTAGLSLHSRTGRPQRGLKLKAKKKFGDKKFIFDPFETNKTASYDQLILRAAGNDNIHHGGVQFRDVLCTSIYRNFCNEHCYSDFQTMNLYLNEEYYGIYHLREKQGKDFIKRHFNHKDFDLLERSSQFPGDTNAIEGSWIHYDAFIEEFHQIANQPKEAFQLVKENIDIENFTDYFILQLYISNTDWLVNNIKFFRPHDKCQKWKFLLWDTDWGLGLWQGKYPHGDSNFNMFQWVEIQTPRSPEALIFSTIIQDQEYKQTFIARLQTLTNSHLNSNNVLNEMQAILDKMSLDIDDHLLRWDCEMKSYENKIDSLELFISERTSRLTEHASLHFGLLKPTYFEIDTTYINGASISVGKETSKEIPLLAFQFEGNDIIFNALPKANQKFLGWYNQDSELLSKRSEIKNPKARFLQPRFSK